MKSRITGRQSFAALSLAALLPLSLACVHEQENPRASPQPLMTAQAETARPNADGQTRAGDTAAEVVPVYTFEVVKSYPHDPKAYTQGLVFLNGEFYESTGLYGSSSLRRVEPDTGKVKRKREIAKEYFAEGIAVFHDRIFQLTWQAHKGFVYERKSFDLRGEFSYEGEGWGLAQDGRSLIMSDGTNQIRFLDPATLKVQRTISVYDQGRPVVRLNELEYIKGEIYANIWETDRIVRLDPASGRILGWIDLTGLLRPEDRTSQTNVLNGIAYDEAHDRLFVTGKLWPKLFEIKLVRK
ncbi:MAG TPA: glutaminyl-peptide cyclotransferase [Pyrinomonadaceae bacterium]